MNLRKPQRALAGVFFAQGLLSGTWASRLAELKAGAGVDDAQLGLAFLVCSIAGVAAGLLGARLIRSVSTPRRLVAVELSYVGSIVAMVMAGSFEFLMVAAAGAGATCVAGVVLRNHGALILERLQSKGVLIRSQAWGGFGMLLAGAAGYVCSASGISLVQQTLITSIIAVVLSTRLASHWRLIAGRPWLVPVKQVRTMSRRAVGALCAMAAFACLIEATAKEWGGVYLHDNLHTSSPVAVLPFLAFSVAMIVGRAAWSSRIDPAERLHVVAALSVMSGAVLVAALVIHQPWLLIAAFGLVGLCVAPVVPVALKLTTSGRSVGFIGSATSLGVMAGPPLLGFISRISSLGVAFLVVPAAGVGVAVCCLALRTEHSVSADAAADLAA